MNAAIQVEHAKIAKAACFEHARQAANHKIQYEQLLTHSNSWIEECLILGMRERMKAEAQHAGSQFACYANYLGGLVLYPLKMFGIPKEISIDPELLQLFEAGFEQQKKQLGE